VALESRSHRPARARRDLPINDPQSHHLILNLAHVTADQLHDASFGEWKCRGGDSAGQARGEPVHPVSAGALTSSARGEF
jgi:hypothetical protein